MRTDEEVIELLEEYRLKNLAVSGNLKHNNFLKEKGLIKEFEKEEKKKIFNPPILHQVNERLQEIEDRLNGETYIKK